MIEVLPGIFWPHKLRVANCYFIKNTLQESEKASLDMLDTAVSVERPIIKRCLKSLRHQHGLELERVFLTHSHQDHAGNAVHLSRTHGANIYCHSHERPYLTGEKKLTKRDYSGSPLFCRTVIQFGDLLLGHPQFNLPQTYESEIFRKDPNYDFLPLPGHTPGSGALIHHPSRSLFFGDCLINCNAVTLRSAPGLHYPFPFFCEDYLQAKASLEKLREVDFDNAFFGHGPPILGNAKSEIIKFLDQNK